MSRPIPKLLEDEELVKMRQSWHQGFLLDGTPLKAIQVVGRFIEHFDALKRQERDRRAETI